MATILDKILAHKVKEVEERRELYPVRLLEKSLYFSSTPVSLRAYLQRSDRSGIIAEIKRRSPSRGEINQYISVEDLSIGYMQAGASALSVLTDEQFFGGSLQDLQTARRFNFCPILRKDFIIDEYQVLEAKSSGADAVLLIAAALEPERVRTLGSLARSLEMEVLLEVHSEAELRSHACPEASLIGVNNRDLSNFTVDVSLSEGLGALIPDEFCKVTESGISDAATIQRLRAAGFEGFLIGEAFMRHSRPEEACRRLISELSEGHAA